jgi:hypothetical protein
MRSGWNGGGNHTSLDAIRAEARRGPAELLAGLARSGGVT